MSLVVAKLNEMLADERRCIDALRRAEVKCNAVNQRALIQRVINACRLICAELEILIVGLGEQAIDIPRSSVSSQTLEESLTECLKTAESTQHEIIAKINAVMDEPDLKRYGEKLRAIQQFHANNIRWLVEALGIKPQRDI
jgi:hypothetical protein